MLQIASQENALIVLRDALRSAGSNVIPVNVERQLAFASLDREYRMRRLRERLQQAVSALTGAGIEVLLLKGAALATAVYGSFTHRPMRDIDLLVRPEQADKARSLLLQLDWVADPDLPGDTSYGTHHHLPPLCDGSGLRLELHRGLLPVGHPFRFSEDEIWRAARTVRVGGTEYLVMQPSHHAVHVAIHFAWSHMLRMGAWHAFRDLDALFVAGQLDWDDFESTAARWGAGPSCYWTLSLGQELSGMSVPESILLRLQPRLLNALRPPLLQHFVRVIQHHVACPSVRLEQLLWSLAMQPNRSGHGYVRPWRVSLELRSDLMKRARGSQTFTSPFGQVRRSSRYLSEILA